MMYVLQFVQGGGGDIPEWSAAGVYTKGMIVRRLGIPFIYYSSTDGLIKDPLSATDGTWKKAIADTFSSWMLNAETIRLVPYYDPIYQVFQGWEEQSIAQLRPPAVWSGEMPAIESTSWTAGQWHRGDKCCYRQQGLWYMVNYDYICLSDTTEAPIDSNGVVSSHWRKNPQRVEVGINVERISKNVGKLYVSATADLALGKSCSSWQAAIEGMCLSWSLGVRPSTESLIAVTLSSLGYVTAGRAAHNIWDGGGGTRYAPEVTNDGNFPGMQAPPQSYWHHCADDNVLIFRNDPSWRCNNNALEKTFDEIGCDMCFDPVGQPMDDMDFPQIGRCALGDDCPEINLYPTGFYALQHSPAQYNGKHQAHGLWRRCWRNTLAYPMHRLGVHYSAGDRRTEIFNSQVHEYECIVAHNSTAANVPHLTSKDVLSSGALWSHADYDQDFTSPEIARYCFVQSPIFRAFGTSGEHAVWGGSVGVYDGSDTGTPAAQFSENYDARRLAGHALNVPSVEMINDMAAALMACDTLGISAGFWSCTGNGHSEENSGGSKQIAIDAAWTDLMTKIQSDGNFYFEIPSDYYGWFPKLSSGCGMYREDAEPPNNRPVWDISLQALMIAPTGGMEEYARRVAKVGGDATITFAQLLYESPACNGCAAQGGVQFPAVARRPEAKNDFYQRDCLRLAGVTFSAANNYRIVVLPAAGQYPENDTCISYVIASQYMGTSDSAIQVDCTAQGGVIDV
jgi:hypothetical protein